MFSQVWLMLVSMPLVTSIFLSHSIPSEVSKCIIFTLIFDFIYLDLTK